MKGVLARPPIYRLNWTRITSWGWWDESDNTALQTQDSKFEYWQSEAWHTTCARPPSLHIIQMSTSEWGGGGEGHLFLWNMNARGSHLHLSSYLVPADSLISRICAMSIGPLSSLANSDNPDKLTWVWPSTLHTVNRWRHNEYSCCSHPSITYSFHRHLLSRSDQWSDCQTGCGKMNVVGGEAAIYNFTHMQLWSLHGGGGGV